MGKKYGIQNYRIREVTVNEQNPQAVGFYEHLVGGVGIAEFEGISDCAEIQKLYLETHSNLKVAMKLYEKAGFQQIERPESVLHGTIDHFYLKKL